jgi:hypothetical protein
VGFLYKIQLCSWKDVVYGCDPSCAVTSYVTLGKLDNSSKVQCLSTKGNNTVPSRPCQCVTDKMECSLQYPCGFFPHTEAPGGEGEHSILVFAGN